MANISNTKSEANDGEDLGLKNWKNGFLFPLTEPGKNNVFGNIYQQFTC